MTELLVPFAWINPYGDINLILIANLATLRPYAGGVSTSISSQSWPEKYFDSV